MSEQLGRGSLRRNKRKYDLVNGKYVAISGKDKHPDYTGKVTLKVAGGEIAAYLSAWVRKDDEGTPYMSLTIDYPQNEQRRLALAGAPVQPQQPVMDIQPDSLDEDLPF
jgi:uncharacterized protein (DUF736 family)